MTSKLLVLRAKKALANSDYKVIKCMEAKLQNKEEMPYDVDALIEEREGYREIIRANEEIAAMSLPQLLQINLERLTRQQDAD